MPHASHLPPHAFRLTPHTSWLTPPASRLMRHASCITPSASRRPPPNSHVPPPTFRLTPFTSRPPAGRPARQGESPLTAGWAPGRVSERSLRKADWTPDDRDNIPVAGGRGSGEAVRARRRRSDRGDGAAASEGVFLFAPIGTMGVCSKKRVRDRPDLHGLLFSTASSGSPGRGHGRHFRNARLGSPGWGALACCCGRDLPEHPDSRDGRLLRGDSQNLPDCRDGRFFG